MNALLKPIEARCLQRPAYRGYWLVRQNNQEAWVRMNADLLAEWFAGCGTTLAECRTETLDSFAGAQWDVERAKYEELKADRETEYDGASDGSVNWEDL